MSSHVVGTANTVLLIEGTAAISSIHVRVHNCEDSKRLTFSRQIGIESSITEHYRTTILDAIDKITGSLGIEKKCYEISIRNIEAASVKGLNMALQGYSADLSIFLALLSASLNLPIPQDVVVTGHLISADGFISPVSGLPEKIHAASVSKTILRMLFPDFNRDKSVAALTPAELERITRATVDSKKSLKIEKIKDLSELTRLVFSEDAICESSLKEGYYDRIEQPITGANPLDNVILYLGNGNQKRFWRYIESLLFDGDFDTVRKLTITYSRFHIKKNTYPKDFGEDLLKLAISLPPVIKNKLGFLPLVQVPDYIQLVQYAKETDYDDVSKLHQAAFEKQSYKKLDGHLQDDIGTKLGADITLQYFLKELLPENIAKQVLIPLDDARASYSINRVTVESYDEFLDHISSFHIHMMRYWGKLSGNIESRQLMGDALALVSNAFYRMGQEKGAYAEAKSGTKGGLRYIFDAMTSLLKSEAQKAYIALILKSAIDPLDYKAKAKVIQTILNQLGPYLTEELSGMPPERFVERFPEIIEAYSESTDHLIEKMKLL